MVYFRMFVCACRSPNSPCKLFVGQIPTHMGEDEVEQLFRPYGEVTYCVVLRDKLTKMHLGIIHLLGVRWMERDWCESVQAVLSFR